MKRIYKKPTVKVCEINSPTILCGSNENSLRLFSDEEADEKYGMD